MVGFIVGCVIFTWFMRQVPAGIVVAIMCGGLSWLAWSAVGMDGPWSVMASVISGVLLAQGMMRATRAMDRLGRRWSHALRRST